MTKNDDNDSRHITSILLWKMVGYAHSSFTDLVFASERIEVGLKRGKFNHPAWTNEKTGANEEGESKGEAHAVTAIPIQPSCPPTQQCHYSANNKPSHNQPNNRAKPNWETNKNDTTTTNDIAQNP